MGVTHFTNPYDAVPGWAHSVVQLWGMCRGDFGMMHLPDEGGMADQSAWLMDAFSVCTKTFQELEKEDQPPP